MARGGMVTGQIDTCITIEYIQTDIFTLILCSHGILQIFNAAIKLQSKLAKSSTGYNEPPLYRTVFDFPLI